MRTTAVFDLAEATLACLMACVFVAPAMGQTPAQAVPAEKPVVFHVKYVSEGTLYIDAGRNADLQEGMKLSVINPPPDGMVIDGIRFRGYPHMAELKVFSLADTSAVCDVISTAGELKVGQLAFLTPDSVEDRHLAENAREAEDYPITVGFTSGDPLDQELRSTKAVNPNLTESPIGVMRARFGFSYGGIQEAGMHSTQLGMMIDADLTHIGGTSWNFNGYWRGNYNSSTNSLPGAASQTLTDLINRTYQIGFTYQNPYSPNTVGIGRLFLPWAPSLSTIDGGYLGRRIGDFTTVGVFGGSTPDPTSWSYNPNQHIAGTFVSVERGDFNSFHMISTAGLAMTSINWRVARQFAFFENNLNWKRYFSFYNSLQADEARTSPLPNGGSNPTGISQTYNSVHFQPIKLVTVGVNYNYFRSLPTFDPRLIATGLLNQYLFQGLSGDLRLDLPKHISLYTAVGRSKASTDTKNSLNEAFGVTFGNIWRTGALLDLHYSKFNSSFGGGQYESISLSKNLSDTLHLQVMGGNQKFTSSMTTNTNAKFVNATLDWSIGRRYFLEGTYGWYNGTTMNYNQWSTVFGYRWGGMRK
ncbi:MAG TPA: hypothetical protein VJX72_12505 [Candidatus Acidoferrum sp.]|nr:hypothetical protein [Candidatus Acidoferrum sp.]